MNIARRIFIYCILVVAFLLAMSVFTPTWAQQGQPMGTPTSNVYSKGMLSADSALRAARQFKVYPYFDSTGELAVVGHKLYYHNGLVWVMAPDTASLSGIYFKKIDSNTHKNAVTLDYLDTQLAQKQDTFSGTGIVESNAGVISYLPDPLPVDNGGTASTAFDAGSVVFLNSGGFQMLGNANLFRRDFSGTGGWVMNSSFPSVTNVGLTLGSISMGGGGVALGFIDFVNGGPITHVLGPTDTNLNISSGGSIRGIEFQINGTKRMAVSSSGDIVMYGSSSGSLTIKAPSVVATYAVTMPSVQGAANTLLENDGSGGLTWAPASAVFSPTTTLTGDVTGVGVFTVVTTIKSSVALPGSPTTTTPSAGDNSTKIPTTAFVTNAVAAITNTVTANYVPYTGATSSVNIGSNSFYTFGRFGIGTASPMTPFEVVETSTGTPRGIANAQYSNSANSAQFHLWKFRGDTTTPLAVQQSDIIGNIFFGGYNGSSMSEFGAIRATVAGVVTTTSVPTSIGIYTGVRAAVLAITVDTAQKVGIGTSAPTHLLEVNGRISTTGMDMVGATSGTLTVTPPAAITSYTVIPPAAVGSSGQVQSISSVSSNSATMGWTTPVTSFSVTAIPIFSVTGSPITSTGAINIAYKGVFAITDRTNFLYSGDSSIVQTVTLGSSRTFTVTNLLVGPDYKFYVTHGTSTTLTWGTTVKSEWNTAGVPPQSTANGARDLYILRYDGTNINVETHLNIN